MTKKNNICDNCAFFRIKSDNYGICDNSKNDTKMLSVNLIRHLTNCDDDIALEINDSIRYNKNFGCIHFEKKPWK